MCGLWRLIDGAATVEIEPRNRAVVSNADAIDGSANTNEDCLLRGEPSLKRSFGAPLSGIMASLFPMPLDVQMCVGWLDLEIALVSVSPSASLKYEHAR